MVSIRKKYVAPYSSARQCKRGRQAEVVLAAFIPERPMTLLRPYPTPRSGKPEHAVVTDSSRRPLYVPGSAPELIEHKSIPAGSSSVTQTGRLWAVSAGRGARTADRRRRAARPHRRVAKTAAQLARLIDVEASQLPAALRDNMDSVSSEAIQAIESDVVGSMVQRSSVDLKQVRFDGTNLPRDRHLQRVLRWAPARQEQG